MPFGQESILAAVEPPYEARAADQYPAEHQQVVDEGKDASFHAQLEARLVPEGYQLRGADAEHAAAGGQQEGDVATESRAFHCA